MYYLLFAYIFHFHNKQIATHAQSLKDILLSSNPKVKAKIQKLEINILNPLIIKRDKIVYIFSIIVYIRAIIVCRYIHIYDLENRSNDFQQIWYYVYFKDEKRSR